MKTKLTLSLVVALACQLTFSAAVTNITSGGAEYATVGAAVAAAASGDTLLLSTGVFAEVVNISGGKLLTFVGGALLDFSGIIPGERSVIDGGGADSVIDVFAGNGLDLFSIELTGGIGFGGGVDYRNYTTGAIVNCYIHHNAAIRSGGVEINNGAFVAMTNTIVAYNSASTVGGGIGVGTGSLVVGPNCYIRDNIAAERGGGIYAYNADVSITGTNTFLGIFQLFSGANNCTNGDGGGLYAAHSDIVLSGEQCYAGYNFSSRDGAAFFITNSSLSLLGGSQINFGWASRNGGGIYAVNSEILMDNADIMYCFATNGGGIFAISSSGTFNKSKIEINGANANVGYGGGLYIALTGSYTFTDSVIANNIAHFGGGIIAYLTAGDFILNNTDVITNRVAGVGSTAAGIYWISAATLEATNGCRISNNLSDDNIGGAYLSALGKFLFYDTEISCNMASNHVGGIAVANAGRMEFIDCSINSNVADADSNGVGFVGAVYVNNASVDLTSLNGTFTVTNNSATDGGAAYILSAGKLSAYGDVLFANNRASRYGGALYATNQCFVSLMPTNGASPRIIDNFANNHGGAAAIYTASEIIAVNPRFVGNMSSNYGGAMYVYGSTATVYAAFSGSNSLPPCVFDGNKAQYGGGIYGHSSSLLNINDSLFVSNSAYHLNSRGGAVRANNNTAVNMINSIVAHNVSKDGGGVAISGSSFLQMRQCTVVDNAYEGVEGGTLAITNSIIWNNDGMEITAGEVVNYCDVDGGYAGAGNIDVNPMFDNPAALDFRLAVGSPCVDTGTVVNINHDCIGNPRPMGSGFDLGAYELDPAPILNVIPLEVDFGDVVVGDDFDLPVSVENLGNGPLNGNVINLMNPIFSVQSGSPYAVAPLSSNVVIFRFSPVVEIPITNIVTFQSNGGNTNVALIGTGIPEPIGIWILGMLELWIIVKNRSKFKT